MYVCAFFNSLKFYVVLLLFPVKKKKRTVQIKHLMSKIDVIHA